MTSVADVGVMLIMNTRYLLFFIVGASMCTAENSDETKEVNAPNVGGLFSECSHLLITGDRSKLADFDVLPGYGWDNLRNKAMGAISRLSYKQCQVKGGKYLIPDNVFMVSKHESSVANQAEIIHHASDYKSVTSNSVNVNAGFSYKLFSIDGSFSLDHLKNKELQTATKSSIARVQARYRTHKLGLYPNSELDPGFKQALIDIAAHLDSNDTDVAEYMAQMLIRHYGTHQITSVDAGALFVSEDAFKVNKSSDLLSDDTKISLAVKAKYSVFFSISTTFTRQVAHSTLNEYENTVTNTRTDTHGGPLWKANMTFNEWLEGVPSNLVTIDRSGDPISLFVTKRNIPELPVSVLFELARLVQKSISDYYSYNTHRGCTNPDSPYFNVAANVDDNSCIPVSSNYSFGGIYQNCRLTSGSSSEACEGLDYGNPLTKGKNCPIGYTDIKFVTDTFQHVYNDYTCKEDCTTTGALFWRKRRCTNNCYYNHRRASAVTEAHWCAKSLSQSDPIDKGMLFGGTYTDKVVNPVTDAKSCPVGFFTLAIGEHTKFCVASRRLEVLPESIPFAGFFTCNVGNPQFGRDTAKNSTKACPVGFSATIAGIVDSCDIYFCSKFIPRGGLAEIHLPPFSIKPTRVSEPTKTLYTQGQNGRLWQKNDVNGTWTLSQQGSAVETNDKYESGLTDGEIAGIGIAAGIVVLALSAVVIYFVKKRRTRISGMKTNSREDRVSTSQETTP